ncbi:MAG: bifunctional diaminohydroxyphosphoribosylaminopyrimidine deaminase/5-amino-6-(5-phosphoribosylamino)uracil reductase RibD [Actinomycetes bacterium]
MTAHANDQAFVARAVVLGELGRATCRPNPAVGCVVTGADGAIVGEGYHARAGGPHAEVVALHAAGARARGGTAYVSLEPCAHHGRTPPCTDALLAAGVARVVFALSDPSDEARGGAEVLRAAGVEVVADVLPEWASTQNEVWLTAQAVGRPFVTLKLAQTLDGLLSVRGRRWLTGEVSRTAVHRQRGWHDVVLVGVGTVLADDPSLDVRHVEPVAAQPRPVVLDTHLRTPPTARVVERGALLLAGASPPADARAALEAAGAEVLEVATGADGRLDVEAALASLHARGVRAVYAEGGAGVAASLVAAGAVDRLHIHLARGVYGPSALPRLAPCLDVPASSGWAWRTERTGELGDDLEIVAVPDPSPVARARAATAAAPHPA